MSANRLDLRFGAAVVLVLAVFGTTAATANAGVLVAAAPDCAAQPLSKPFTPWLDYADYTPLSGASFEDAADGWAMTDGSAVANGNSPYSDGAHALSLPAGGSATSPSICVGLEHPTVRFFAKRRSGGLLSPSTLRVDVLFELASGDVASLPIGVVLSSGSWQPTLPMLNVANLLPLLPGEKTAIAYRFTAQGAAWSVDDVWVDPYFRR